MILLKVFSILVGHKLGRMFCVCSIYFRNPFYPPILNFNCYQVFFAREFSSEKFWIKVKLLDFLRCQAIHFD